MSRNWQELLIGDHEQTERVFAAVKGPFTSPSGPPPALAARFLEYARDYVDRCHNQKEEQHLFPLLERRGVSRTGGPLAVMLAEHEAAREMLARLEPMVAAWVGGDASGLAALRQLAGDYVTLCTDHYWKENDILFPLAAKTLTADDVAAVERGIAAVEAALGPDTHARYAAMAAELIEAGGLKDLAHGVDREVLAAILNTLPVELSFVDADDTVRYFSHERATKIFPRTRGVIGAKVQDCHPQQSVHVVNRILADFKAGRRDVAEFWIPMGPRFVHIRYWPVRGADGRYLGCLETVQDVAGIRALEGQKRLLDPA
jgi:hypothetical protein